MRNAKHKELMKEIENAMLYTIELTEDAFKVNPEAEVINNCLIFLSKKEYFIKLKSLDIRFERIHEKLY
jgi:hypothetical protein